MSKDQRYKSDSMLFFCSFCQWLPSAHRRGSSHEKFAIQGSLWPSPFLSNSTSTAVPLFLLHCQGQTYSSPKKLIAFSSSELICDLNALPLGQLVDSILVHDAIHTSHQWRFPSSTEVVSCPLCVASVANVGTNMHQHSINAIIADFTYLSVSPPRLWASWGQTRWLHHFLNSQHPAQDLWRNAYRGCRHIFSPYFCRVVQGLTVTEIPKSPKNFKFPGPWMALRKIPGVLISEICTLNQLARCFEHWKLLFGGLRSMYDL